jgi:Uma2 family endonuclease
MESTISNPTHDLQTEIYYPDSDGQPMANNTLHAEYITTTKYGIESVFAEWDDVFVAMDLFWYPVQGKPKTVLAPDVMVALGRPKGARKSYKQWQENNVAPQIVFEFLSESNTTSEMTRKATFFERYGVQEYYMYDIERKILSGFVRYQEEDDALEEIADMNDWKSPRLGIRFDMSSGELQLYKPDGEPFLSFEELNAELSDTRSELSETRKQNDRYATKLRELGINPDML